MYRVIIITTTDADEMTTRVAVGVGRGALRAGLYS
jgi:hypothetical protein